MVDDSPPHRLPDAELARRRAESAELLEVARPHLERLSATCAPVPHVAFVVDRDGIVLHATGTAPDALRAPFLPGRHWSERDAATRAAASAPVRAPEGELLGTLALATDETGASEPRQGVAYAAWAVERELSARDALRRADERLEAERRSAEARYLHIAANAPGMVYQYVFRADGTKGYTFVSEGARTLFGVAPEAALRDAAALLDLIHPEDRPRFQELAMLTATQLVPFRWEGRVLLSSGEERFIEIAAHDQRLEDGTIVSDGLVIDVTDRKRAERALRESEEQYRRLVEHAPDGIIIHRDREIIYANPAAARLAGAPDPEALVGRIGLDLIHPDEHARAAERMRAIASGEPATSVVEQRWLRFDGSVYDVEVQSQVFVHEGRPAVQTVFRDITARKALEAQLRQAQKMEAIGQLAGGVAHDFNNLLTVIRVNAELAREGLDAAHPLSADIDEIRRAAARASGLTHQLLAFSRKQLLAPRVLDLNAVVAGLEPMLRRLIGEDIAVRTSLSRELGPVLADPGQLEQVLVNLAVNARDAMPGGGALTIATGNIELAEHDHNRPADVAPGSWVTLIVSDTGEGMTPEVHARIFEPFYTTKPTGKGTGLGLSTVYGIVKQSGGHVSVDSELGAGCTFTLYLPRASRPGAPRSPTPASVPRQRGQGTVLLVEDEESVRRIARRILERRGWSVLEACDGRDALALATAHTGPLDLVLTDVVMPGMNGRALVEQLASTRPALRVLYMSGYTDDEIIRRGHHHPGTSFLPKPFTADALMDAVRAAMEGVGAGAD